MLRRLRSRMADPCTHGTPGRVSKNVSRETHVRLPPSCPKPAQPPAWNSSGNSALPVWMASVNGARDGHKVEFHF